MSKLDNYKELGSKTLKKAGEVVSSWNLREKFSAVVGTISEKLTRTQQVVAATAATLVIAASLTFVFSGSNGMAQAETVLANSVPGIGAEQVDDSAAVQTRPQIRGGTVLPIADMGAALRQENHQQSMIFGQFTFDETNKRAFNRTTLLTTSPNLETWYLLSGNGEIGQPSTELGVDFAGIDLQVYDPERTDLPTISEHNFRKRAALRDIAALNQEFMRIFNEADYDWGPEGMEHEGLRLFGAQQASFYNDLIEEIYNESNARVVFEGRVIDADTGTPEGWLTFLEEPGTDFMAVIRTTESGASYQVNFGFDKAYFPDMQDLIDQAPAAPQQVAGNTTDEEVEENSSQFKAPSLIRKN